MKTRILIDSVTYVSQVDVRQERNCDTNDISITVFPKFCMLSNLADLVELGTETTMAWLRRSLLRNSVNNSPTSSKILITISFVTLRFITCLTRVVDLPGHYRAQGSSKRCNRCRWETWTKWKPFIRKRNEAFRYTPWKETTTICVKQAALRLVDRLADSVPQPTRKEGYMPFHPFHRKLQSHMLCSSNG